MPGKSAARFSVFRGADAPALSEIDVMDFVGMTPELAEIFGKLGDAGLDEGQTVKLLFAAPGFSLTYAWFRSGFPLPRHSHSADCLYYVAAGSLTLGSVTLGAGDGFFVPADAAYTYVAGPEGVEVLEFRNAERFDMRFLPGNPAFWAKALDSVRKEREGWKDQLPPSRAVRTA
ncbi:hypothetical protein HY78_18455 [Rhizorhabdus wittichii DC-6]|nr:hypothetical protein HY78_18455 [Rhizorhabdus wittichii DC-6]